MCTDTSQQPVQFSLFSHHIYRTQTYAISPFSKSTIPDEFFNSSVNTIPSFQISAPACTAGAVMLPAPGSARC